MSVTLDRNSFERCPIQVSAYRSTDSSVEVWRCARCRRIMRRPTSTGVERRRSRVQCDAFPRLFPSLFFFFTHNTTSQFFLCQRFFFSFCLLCSGEINSWNWRVEWSFYLHFQMLLVPTGICSEHYFHNQVHCNTAIFFLQFSLCCLLVFHLAWKVAIRMWSCRVKCSFYLDF